MTIVNSNKTLRSVIDARNLLITALVSSAFAAAFIAADRHSSSKLQQAGAGTTGAGMSAGISASGTSASGVSGELDWQSLDLERFSAPMSPAAMRASGKALSRELQTPTVWR